MLRLPTKRTYKLLSFISEYPIKHDIQKFIDKSIIKKPTLVNVEVTSIDKKHILDFFPTTSVTTEIMTLEDYIRVK